MRAARTKHFYPIFYFLISATPPMKQLFLALFLLTSFVARAQSAA